MQDQLEIMLRIGVAALGGLAVGIEREWSGRVEGGRPRFAGVRTFLLIGLLGALSMIIMNSGSQLAGGAILVAAALLIVAAYTAAAIRGERDSTTEFAAVVVLAAGCMAGSGRLAMASALNAFTALVLVEKSRIHSAVYSLKSEELSAGFRFAVMALVILPLLPVGPFGPAPGIRPRELWALVLLFSGINFAAFIARRAVGNERGYRIAGFLGGLISSTAVTLDFSRQSRSEPASGNALAYGVIAACTVLPLRVIVLTMVLNSSIGRSSFVYLLIPFVAGLIVLFFFKRSPSTEIPGDQILPKNPLRLVPAIQMVIAFQVGLYVIQWVSLHFGSTGLFTTAAVMGAGDTDTLVFSLSKQPGLAPMLASQALILGVFVSMLVKVLLSVTVGSGRYRLVAAYGVGVLAVATLSGLVFSLLLT
jgi:uncharacterized membrane protein (DUF4010 family)